MYDPRIDGADCDHCPMKRWAAEEWHPVRAQRAHTSGRLLLGEAPGRQEEERGRPFVGESGTELNDALKAVGIQRLTYDVDNVIACRCPKDKWELLNAKLRRDKASGASPGHEQHPALHCRPRLEKSLTRATNIVALGGKAAAAVLGGNPSILSIRGGPVTLDNGTKVLPTVHPAFVRRARRWRSVLQADLRRAERFFTNTLRWKDPLIHHQPTAAELRTFLAYPSKLWSYDVETDAREPLLANLRCLAIARDATPQEQEQGYEDAVVVIGLRSVEVDEPSLYLPWDEEEILNVLRRAFVDGRMWCGHNAGWYDRLVIEQHLGVTPKPLLDTIMLARLTSELPKSLAVQGSLYTDCTSWKNEAEGLKGYQARTDHDLHTYCAIDTAVTHRIAPVLAQKVALRNQSSPCPAKPSLTLSQLDHQIQSVCAGMTRTGMFIDVQAQAELEHRLEHEVRDLRERVVALSGDGVFNPASHPQVRSLLYSRTGFDLDPIDYTDLGDPSTNANCLRQHLMQEGTPYDAAQFIHALRAFRGKHKLLTTFVRPLKRRSVDPEKGVLDDDGRLRVAWSAHIPVTGRLSSSQPMNVQNWPKAMRKLVVAAPGHVLVGADFDQLEGRIGAARWGLEKYLAAYRQEGMDPHQLTMEFCFGQRVWNLPGAPAEKYRKKGISGKFNDLRQLAKTYLYAKTYSAGDETVFDLLRRVEDEDEDGNVTFPYANMRLGEVAAMSRRFLEACPQLVRGWDREVAFFRSRSFNIEPLTGRRRDFADGFEKCEIVNFPVQGSAAALMNIATLDVVDSGFGCGFAGGGTGPIQQGHDALVLEVPEAEAETARQVLEACMTQHYPGIYDVAFTAAADTGHSWYEV